MENEPFEDVFPIEHGDIPASYVGLPEGMLHSLRVREKLLQVLEEVEMLRQELFDAFLSEGSRFPSLFSENILYLESQVPYF